MLWKIWETRWEMPWMEDSEKERRGSAKLLLFFLEKFLLVIFSGLC